MISVDMDHTRVSTEHGEPVFLEHGGNSEYLERVNSILHAVLEGMRHSKPFLDTLDELNLIESFVLDVRLDDGSEHRLAGFWTLYDGVLWDLDGEQLGGLLR